MPICAVWSAKNPPPRLRIERRRLAKEIGHGQVEQAIAIEVAAGDAHPRLVKAVGAGGHAGEVAGLLESETRPG